MINKILHTIFTAIIISFLAVISSVKAEITYPILDLGNCSSQKECAAFCDDSTNHMTCVSWAESEGVFTDQQAKRMKDVNRMQEYEEGKNVDPVSGPGNCATRSECDAYCRIEGNLDECLQFSVDNGYISLEEANQEKANRDRGGPGGCSSDEECRDFCGNPDNMETCMDFVVEEGKITREEADFMIQEVRMHQRPMDESRHDPEIDEQKIAEILREEAGPGGCRTMEQCADFCGDISHSEECMDFAKKKQLISPEEIEKAERMMSIAGPGGCVGPIECDAYCGQKEHMEECFNFVKENDLIGADDIDRMEREMMIMKKIDSEGGPGGCRSPEECDVFCSNPENRETCMNFSIDSGMISREDMERMQIIEEKMRRNQDGEMMMDGEMHQEGIIFPSDKEIYPGDMDYPEGDYEEFPHDEKMPLEGEVYHDGTMSPPNQDMHFDEGSFPGGDDGAMSPEGEMYHDEIISPDKMDNPSGWEEHYDNSVSPEGEVYYDDVAPQEGESEGEVIIEGEPVSHSEGLFHPLLNQVRNLLANTGIFFQ